jgi:hypothetical protein
MHTEPMPLLAREKRTAERAMLAKARTNHLLSLMFGPYDATACPAPARNGAYGNLSRCM